MGPVPCPETPLQWLLPGSLVGAGGRLPWPGNELPLVSLDGALGHVWFVLVQGLGITLARSSHLFSLWGEVFAEFTRKLN